MRVEALKHWNAGVAQLVEQLICNQQVTGSSPVASTTVGDGLMLEARDFLEGCPSGQRERAVNPSAYAYGGSNPPPSTKFLRE